MKIKLDIDEIRKNINSDKSFDELLKEWGDVISDHYKERFAIALKERDVVEAVSLISKGAYKRPNYHQAPFKRALVVELHREFENAFNDTKIDGFLTDILSGLSYQEIIFEDDKCLYNILRKSDWPIYRVTVDKLILSKPFMRLTTTKSMEEIADICFVNSEIKEIVKE